MPASVTRMANPGDAIKRGKESPPERSLPWQHAASAGSEPVQTSATLAGLVNPSAFDQTLAFQAI